MPSATREVRPNRPVARRTRPFCTMPDCPSARYFGTFSIPSIEESVAGGQDSDQERRGIGDEDFSLSNLERDVTRMQGSLLTIGFGLTEAENALREVNSVDREVIYRSGLSVEDRRAVAGDLEKIKGELEGVMGNMGRITGRIVNACSRVRMLGSLSGGGGVVVEGGRVDGGGGDEGEDDEEGASAAMDLSVEGGGEGNQSGNGGVRMD